MYKLCVLHSSSTVSSIVRDLSKFGRLVVYFKSYSVPVCSTTLVNATAVDDKVLEVIAARHALHLWFVMRGIVFEEGLVLQMKSRCGTKRLVQLR
eukprot:m.336085 g.336085  ORF g.336085 m.336085 type:complete len:95 (+) comp16078_c0_seq2:6209-6493(+)